jgi:hypothetical protein
MTTKDIANAWRILAVFSGMISIWAPSSRDPLEPALPVSPERWERFSLPMNPENIQHSTFNCQP